MSMKFTDLQCKEVICIANGQRLGFVSDVLVEIPDGTVSAIVVPGRCRWGGFSPPREDYVIPWGKICRIGPDIVLVEADADACRVNRPKGRPAVPGLGKIH